jgi:DNA-binding response OmpR family regulator
MKILFVDERRTIGELLKSRLAGSRYRAADGSSFDIDIEVDYAKASTLLQNGHRYDAAIIECSTTAAAAGDVAFNLVSALKQTAVLAIVFTALPSLDECVRYMRAGAWDYIAKVRPIDELVQRLVDGFKALQPPPADPDALFVEENFATLHRDYAGDWIAVGNGVLLGTAKTHEQLLREIERIPVARPKIWRMPPPPKES